MLWLCLATTHKYPSLTSMHCPRCWLHIFRCHRATGLDLLAITVATQQVFRPGLGLAPKHAETLLGCPVREIIKCARMLVLALVE